MREPESKEIERLEALNALDLLDSASDPDFDQVARLAAAMFRVPVALVTVTSETRNWFKARHGTELCESPRQISFCTHAIAGEGLFEIPDPVHDVRFCDNPLVTGPPFVRYYAGMPIIVGGHAVGTLCLLDHEPRAPMDAFARQNLVELTALLVALIETRRSRSQGPVARALSAALPEASEKAEHLETLRFAEEICENLPATLFVKDATTRRYLLLNRAGEELTGLSSEDVVGRTDDDVWPRFSRAYHERDSRVLQTGESETFESEFQRADGKTRILRTRRVAVAGADGEPLYLLGIGEDVTDWRRAQQELAFAAGHDALTGLYNRDHFNWTLDAALADHCPTAGGPPRPGGEVALLALDLDRFSSIVAAHGRAAADELLIDVAARIRLATRPGISAARFDADRFFVMVPGASAGRRAEALGRELLESVATRRGAAGVTARARVGIAVAPRDGENAETLVASAELASLRAKGSGPGDPSTPGLRIAFFERAQDDAAKRRVRVEERLELAIAADAIDVHYQPIIDLASNRISGFEALARWHDEELGDVSPVEFIPVAEAGGAIGRLGLGVLAKAAREAAGWSANLTLSVNFSAAQFSGDRLADTVADTIEAAGLDPHRLEVEITESLLIAPDERVLDTLRRMKAMGCTIAMDDFGTGYSSLSYFCSFPFDKVKIDQVFVRDMTTSREARAIVRAVIGLAHATGMKVAGEGVENEAQLEALRAEGCDLAQGFLIGRPTAGIGFTSEARTALGL